MATADLSGLFGGVLTPEEQQMQMTENRAAQFAKLDPSQQLAFMGYKAGAGLGQGLAQAAGVDIRDPIIKRNMSLYELAKGIDVTNVEGLQQYAARLQQAGFNSEAAQLGQKILAARKTESEITRNERERKGLDPFEQLLRTGKYTPASLAKYKKSGDATDLELMEKETKANIKEIGVAEGTREPVYLDVNNDKQFIYTTDAQGNQVRKLYTGGVDRTTAKVTATAEMKGRGAFTERLGGKDADRVDASISARESANAQLDIADRIEAMNPTAMSGQFANTRAGAVNFLDSLGLTSPKDKQMLMASEVLTADTSRLVLATLNNKLGGGISNADAKRVEQLFPQLENSPAARQELVNIIRRSANKVIKESYRLEDYARKNEGLGGYKSEIKLPGAAPRNPYSGLSDAELDARIRAAQGNK